MVTIKGGRSGVAGVAFAIIITFFVHMQRHTPFCVSSMKLRKLEHPPQLCTSLTASYYDKKEINDWQLIPTTDSLTSKIHSLDGSFSLFPGLKLPSLSNSYMVLIRGCGRGVAFLNCHTTSLILLLPLAMVPHLHLLFLWM